MSHSANDCRLLPLPSLCQECIWPQVAENPTCTSRSLGDNLKLSVPPPLVSQHMVTKWLLDLQASHPLSGGRKEKERERQNVAWAVSP